MPEVQPRKESNAHVWPRMNSYEPSARPVRLRQMAKSLKLSKEACLRLEWFLWHEAKAQGNVSLTCRHFGISRKTFYRWKKGFDTGNLRTLEDKSRAPHHVRQPMYSQEQYLRFLPLRRRYLRYGKEKLLRIYQREYPDDATISLWHIQCMIVRSGLYWNAKKNGNIQRKRRRRCGKPRKKIFDLPKEARSGFLVCMDTVHRSCRGKTRYILTAIDPYSKVAFARAYTTHSSATAKDFLCRLYYLLDGRITNIQTDNGSEFGKHFERTLKDLKIPHYFSRPRTPKDNAVNERFNRILDEECLKMGNMTDDLPLLNERLTEWLVEYNFRRPHQALNYEPPMNYHYRKLKVLPMCPSSTVN